MRLPCSLSASDRLRPCLIGPLPQDAVRPEDGRRGSLGVAVSEAWEEGWPNFEWRGHTYQTQPRVRLVSGRTVLPAASDRLPARGVARAAAHCFDLRLLAAPGAYVDLLKPDGAGNVRT